MAAADDDDVSRALKVATSSRLVLKVAAGQQHSAVATNDGSLFVLGEGALCVGSGPPVRSSWRSTLLPTAVKVPAAAQCQDH